MVKLNEQKCSSNANMLRQHAFDSTRQTQNKQWRRNDKRCWPHSWSPFIQTMWTGWCTRHNESAQLKTALTWSASQVVLVASARRRSVHSIAVRELITSALSRPNWSKSPLNRRRRVKVWKWRAARIMTSAKRICEFECVKNEIFWQISGGVERDQNC